MEEYLIKRIKELEEEAQKIAQQAANEAVRPYVVVIEELKRTLEKFRTPQ